MGKRIDRSVSEETRRKISISLKDYYRRRISDRDRIIRSSKQSESMRRYWATIPKLNNNENTIRQ
jgi:hypothetical protein